MKNGTVYAEFVYFALLQKNNQHVHHLIGCSKKKEETKKEKKNLTYRIIPNKRTAPNKRAPPLFHVPCISSQLA